MAALPEGSPVLLTWEEYVKFEEVYEGRHELIGGRVRLMSGGSERHDLTVQAIYDQVRPALRDGPCHVFLQNRKLRTSDTTGYYPDLLVRCGSAADRHWEDDARVVIEVLSPSNHPLDVTQKLLDYRELPSIETVLFVDHLGRFVTAHERVGGGWTERRLTAGPHVVNEMLTIDWSQVWKDVDAEATVD